MQDRALMKIRENRLIRLATDETDKLLSLRLKPENRIRLTDTCKKNESPLPKVGDFLLAKVFERQNLALVNDRLLLLNYFL